MQGCVLYSNVQRYTVEVERIREAKYLVVMYSTLVLPVLSVILSGRGLVVG